MLAIALGAVVATDAGTSGKLAWVGVSVAVLMVAIGLAVRSSTLIHLGLGLLGAMLVLRQDARLLLAPIYGGGLLLVEELSSRSIELGSVRWIGPGVISARALAVIAVAGLGVGAGAVAAIAVTGAPGRSVALTAVAALALIAVFVVIARYTRGSYSSIAGSEAGAATDEPSSASSADGGLPS